MISVATLKSQVGADTSIVFDPGPLHALVRVFPVDAYIVAAECGFSPLGLNTPFLSRDLGVPEAEIRSLADWNRFENPRVSLIAIRTRRQNSLLRGIILAAAETSECYKRFAVPIYGRPYRDFYYNVTYEAIAYSAARWGARKLAISHLSAGARFHVDIATCNAEALAHYCNENASSIDMLAFVGCCIAESHLDGISKLNAGGSIGKHRPIPVESEERDGYALVHLDCGVDGKAGTGPWGAFPDS